LVAPYRVENLIFRKVKSPPIPLASPGGGRWGITLIGALMKYHCPQQGLLHRVGGILGKRERKAGTGTPAGNA